MWHPDIGQTMPNGQKLELRIAKLHSSYEKAGQMVSRGPVSFGF
jgi:hypothetical protein